MSIGIKSSSIVDITVSIGNKTAHYCYTVDMDLSIEKQPSIAVGVTVSIGIKPSIC